MAGDTFTIDFFECDDEEDFARRLRLAVYGPWVECEPCGVGLQPWEETALLPRLRRQLGNNPSVDRRRKAPSIGFVR
jgi:hypothetical protein